MGSQVSSVPNLSDQTGTVSAVAGAATLNKQAGVVTSESLSTAAGSDYTLTLTNALVSANTVPFVGPISNGTNTTLYCVAHSWVVSAGQLVVKVRNAGGGALNGTILIPYVLL